MAVLTNHSQGLRGVNLKSGDVRWIEAGQSADIDQADIAGELPDRVTVDGSEAGHKAPTGGKVRHPA